MSSSSIGGGITSQLPLTLRPRHYPTDPTQAARMVIAADRAGLDALRLSHALLRALWLRNRIHRIPRRDRALPTRKVWTGKASSRPRTFQKS